MQTHLAEMLLDLKFRGPRDQLRRRHPFSADIAAVNAILFSPRYSKRRKLKTYREWLESNQPCVFGRVAAKNRFVFVCLLEEHEIVRMKQGDDDLREIIQDYRQAWKRYALEGLSSSFVLVLVSQALTERAPGLQLKEICRRLLELYMEADRVDDDTILPQREYVFLRRPGDQGTHEILKFSTLPNVFCSQGDGRWWHDHRTPGGVMITSNALGHFTYARLNHSTIGHNEKLLALENAMRTISNAFPGPGKKRPRGIRHCPATSLVPISTSEVSPLRETSAFRGYSPDHYTGFFHTDHLIPSAFFHEDRDPKELARYENLSLRYIFDSQGDPLDHAELMTGLPATWYEVRRSMDRLPQFVSPEVTTGMSDKQKARLGTWLETRLQEKLDS